jgi:hypothetical protein
MESLMCNHPYFADTISREEFRRPGIRPFQHDRQLYMNAWCFPRKKTQLSIAMEMFKDLIQLTSHDACFNCFITVF